MNINPEYKPPPDYKPPMIKVNDKVMIPQEEHPEINFVGLLIGPRGNTLKCKGFVSKFDALRFHILFLTSYGI